MTAIAYETVTDGKSLPLLTPMSEVAGRMAAQIGAQFLEKPKGGKGILLAGVPGVSRGKSPLLAAVSLEQMQRKWRSDLAQMSPLLM